MKKFVDKPKVKPLMPETTKAINDGMEKVSEVGIVYYMALAKMRAKLDAKRGNHEVSDRSVPDVYMSYYRQAYDEMWHSIVEESMDNDENGQ